MKRFGLPKTGILRQPREFLRVYKQGRRAKGPGFSLIYLANDLPCNRLGISIHRMLRGSVKRNRIKRTIREVFRLNRDLFPQTSDIVVTVGPNFSLASAESVRRAVVMLASRYQAEQA